MMVEAASQDELTILPENMPMHIREVFAKSTCLFSKSEVDAALDGMATALSYRFADQNPIFLCVVVGGIVTVGNLLPRLNFPLEVDYVHATRYCKGTIGKDLTWKARPATDLKDRTVVIVDDILDGGITMQSIVEYCHKQQASSVITAVLVDKLEARLPEGLQQADFSGLKIDNHYVFGYGLDYKGYLRNAPGIYMVAPEHE